MTLVLQIVVLLVVLTGLITIIMSIKNWHWAQMLLVLSIFFTSLGVLVLGLEVFRIHRNIRSKIPALEQRLAEVEATSEALLHGTRDPAVVRRIFPEGPPFDFEAEGRMPGMGVWTQRLRTIVRERGRVWRDVTPAGALNQAGQVPVNIPQPKPHGLAEGSIVYAFEAGPPNAANPSQGPQYLGEFRVVQAADNGATLEPTQRLDERATARLEASVGQKRPWTLYEVMPADRYERFAGLSDEQLKQLLPAASVAEFIRHGTPATADDDEFHRAGYDEQKRRVGPENADKAVEWRYERPLRDYAYLFGELLRQRVAMMTDIAGLNLDIARWKEALQTAGQLAAQRKQHIAALTTDLEHMERDRQAVEKLLATIKGQLANAEQQVVELIGRNAQLGRQLIELQLSRLEQIQARPVSAAAATR